MTKEELKSHYSHDKDTGCRHWSGPSKVWYEGRMWYPHRLLWYLVNKIEVPSKHSLVRQCGSADCISPAHYTLQPKQSPIAQYQYHTSKP